MEDNKFIYKLKYTQKKSKAVTENFRTEIFYHLKLLQAKEMLCNSMMLYESRGITSYYRGMWIFFCFQIDLAKVISSRRVKVTTIFFIRFNLSYEKDSTNIYIGGIFMKYMQIREFSFAMLANNFLLDKQFSLFKSSLQGLLLA